MKRKRNAYPVEKQNCKMMIPNTREYTLRAITFEISVWIQASGKLIAMEKKRRT